MLTSTIIKIYNMPQRCPKVCGSALGVFGALIFEVW